MRGKIALSFLGVAILSILLIILITIGGIYYFFFSKDIITTDYPPNLTLSFKSYIEVDEGTISINREGQELLKKNHAWIQVLDQNGNEVYELDKPADAPSHYSPADIVHYHMYPDTIGGYTLFVSSTESDSNYDYIIGFPSTTISKHIFEYESSTSALIIKSVLLTFFISIAVFLIVGFIFGNRLTTPLLYIIQGVDFLAQDKYIIDYEEKGIYGKVFRSLNKLTENLRLSKRERAKIEKMREEWIANISHDLKTPLSSIKGYAEVLANKDYEISKKEVFQYSNTILNKANYMEELIEELTLHEKLKSNALVIYKRKVNLTKFLRNLIIEILNHPGCENRLIHFYPQAENIEYEFDESLMRRCISNLIFNALIHNRESTEVFVYIRKQDKINIEIKDNGNGINEEDLKKLFNRYYRGTNTNSHKGSGLGMSIAKEVIEAHGGSIFVESELNKGTSIKIEL
ncbi:two-component sensor histidine kinase [Caldibacillus thermoamylovorans]|uniref:sensor histidine kinase n=1 Tax=Caldibacillus thermoamylovorans TaxID=35841 RepID=UPI000D55B695|nr:HAMP domain-containing sensor histidine kinase [Caldibacillus thermoamylovorans]AWI14038.1 two-component sensor histidine kinase [Caldibacillus thermoamylovorans]